MNLQGKIFWALFWAGSGFWIGCYFSVLRYAYLIKQFNPKS